MKKRFIRNSNDKSLDRSKEENNLSSLSLLFFHFTSHNSILSHFLFLGGMKKKKKRTNQQEKKSNDPSQCISTIDFTQFLAAHLLEAVYIKTSVYLTLILHIYMTEIRIERRKKKEESEKKRNCRRH